MVILLILFSLILIIELVRFYLSINRVKKAKKELKKREQEQHYLNFLTTSAVEGGGSVAENFPRYLNYLKEAVNWNYHSIFRLDEATQLLPIRFTGYLPEWYMRELSTRVLVKVGDISIGRAIATKQPVTINAAIIDPRFKDVTSLVAQMKYQSLTCCPMIGRLRTYGGFCTYSEYKNIFTLHDTQFLLTCSNLFAAILENRLLQNYLKTVKHQIT
ncbi:MAG: GAF domain-containing protein [Candidatus Daviesbacteria bacterium]